MSNLNIEVEDAAAWLREHFNAKSIREAADRLQMDNQKLKRWLGGETLPYCVIALAKAYDFDPVYKLVEVGLLESSGQTGMERVPESMKVDEIKSTWLRLTADVTGLEVELASRQGTSVSEARAQLNKYLRNVLVHAGAFEHERRLMAGERIIDIQREIAQKEAEQRSHNAMVEWDDYEPDPEELQRIRYRDAVDVEYEPTDEELAELALQRALKESDDEAVQNLRTKLAEEESARSALASRRKQAAQSALKRALERSADLAANRGSKEPDEQQSPDD